MTKQDFLENLKEKITDKILVTDDPQLLTEELSENCRLISVNNEIADQLEVMEIENFLKKIRKNRLDQLIHSNVDIDLIYYSWFDGQACQLKFNLINSNHKRLPFDSTVNLVKKENKIIREFLNSNYHNGISWTELEDVSTDSIDYREEEKNSTVNVYKEIINKTENK